MDYSSVKNLPGSVKAVAVRNVKHFDVNMIFDCGQAFRFNPVAGSAHESEWSGVARGRFISVAQDGDDVIIYNADEADFYAIWEKYFTLDADYGEIEADILSRSDSPRLREAVEHGDGIRILRQEPWETLCSFIISQNNNIPRIKSLVSALSAAAGERVNTAGMETHGASDAEYSFPSAERTAALGEQALKDLHMGFRAGYIADTSSRVASGEASLDAVYGIDDTADASAYLQQFRGVGPKVAACALLFGFFRTDSFPIDVWIRRVLEKYYPAGFDPKSLGPYAGIAQQYLFRYERETSVSS